MSRVETTLAASRLHAGADAAWELRVTNHGADPLDLTLPTSQLADLVLEREGSIRYRWSDGRVFLQVVGRRTLAGGETWAIVLEGPLDVAPGEYDAVATVACTPPLPPAQSRVVVGAA